MNWHRALSLLIVLIVGAHLSARSLHVDQHHPEANDTNPGTADQPLKSISPAAALAQPGDVVMIADGVYREHVSPAMGGSAPDQMIAYVAVHGHRPVITGSDPWRPTWTQAKLEGVTAAVYQAELDESLFTYDFPIEDFNPFHLPLSRMYAKDVPSFYEPVRPVEPEEDTQMTRGMVFIEGQPLRQIIDPAAFERASGVFMVPADGKSILVRLPFDREPHGLTFEITTREQAFAPRELGKNFIRLKGLTFEHGANGFGVPQFGMVSSSRGRYWIIEECTFRWAGTAGLDMGEMAWYTPPGRTSKPSPSTGKLDFDKIVRRCTFADNGVVGVWSYGGGPHLVEDCVFERNRWRSIEIAEDGGIKCHAVSNSVFRNNLFRENDTYALWLDVVGSNNRITQNLFIDNRNAGVFIERTARTTLVDNNICLFTRPWTYSQMTQSDGFYNHQASNVIFAHNLSMGNYGFGYRCILWGGNDSSNSFHPYKAKVSHNRILNNIAYANARGAVSLPVDQKFCWGNISDHNFIWGAANAPLFELQRGVADRAELVSWIERGIAEHQIPIAEALMLHRWKGGQLGPEVGDMRHTGPLVGLPIWQKVRGFDTHSVVGTLPVCQAYRDGRIVLHVKRPKKTYGASKMYSESGQAIGARPQSYGDLNEVECPRLPYIKYDYFGKLRPTDQPPTVGPIQDLPQIAGGDRAVEIVLWPNASPDRPPATEMQIDIEPRSFIGDWEKTPEGQ